MHANAHAGGFAGEGEEFRAGDEFLFDGHATGTVDFFGVDGVDEFVGAFHSLILPSFNRLAWEVGAAARPAGCSSYFGYVPVSIGPSGLSRTLDLHGGLTATATQS